MVDKQKRIARYLQKGRDLLTGEKPEIEARPAKFRTREAADDKPGKTDVHEQRDARHQRRIEDPMRFFGKDHAHERESFRKPETAPERPEFRQRETPTQEDIEYKKAQDIRDTRDAKFDRRGKQERDPNTLEMDLGEDQRSAGEKRQAFENREPELGRTGNWTEECFGVYRPMSSCLDPYSAPGIPDVARDHFANVTDALKAYANEEGPEWKRFEKACEKYIDWDEEVYFDCAMAELHAEH